MIKLPVRHPTRRSSLHTKAAINCGVLTVPNKVNRENLQSIYTLQTSTTLYKSVNNPARKLASHPWVKQTSFPLQPFCARLHYPEHSSRKDRNEQFQYLYISKTPAGCTRAFSNSEGHFSLPLTQVHASCSARMHISCALMKKFSVFEKDRIFIEDTLLEVCTASSPTSYSARIRLLLPCIQAVLFLAASNQGSRAPLNRVQGQHTD